MSTPKKISGYLPARYVKFNDLVIFCSQVLRLRNLKLGTKLKYTNTNIQSIFTSVAIIAQKLPYKDSDILDFSFGISENKNPKICFRLWVSREWEAEESKLALQLFSGLMRNERASLAVASRWNNCIGKKKNRVWEENCSEMVSESITPLSTTISTKQAKKEGQLHPPPSTSTSTPGLPAFVSMNTSPFFHSDDGD